MIPEGLNTVQTLMHDFRAVGVQPGMTLVVHTSFKAIGEVSGGPVAVILALEGLLGEAGTLVMPTHTGNLSDPAYWKIDPVPESWWQPIRDTMPAYDPALTPTWRMGIIAETFRKQDGVIRSANPDASFAAWGKHSHQIIDNHALFPLFGEQSPLARVYDLEGWVLLLGVGHGNNTSLHVAEGRANIPRQMQHFGSPMRVDGVRQWVAFEDIDWDDSDFVQIGADFARETGLQHAGKVGNAATILVPQRPLIDYAVGWLERHRKSEHA
jgi:aminoglycoside 3-N-acetyltransferase